MLSVSGSLRTPTQPTRRYVKLALLPLLFDLFVMGLLVGGCVLMYVGLRSGSENQASRGEPAIEDQRKIAMAPPDQRMAFLNRPMEELSVAVLDENSAEPNKYARSVSAALARSRKPSAG